MPRQQTLTTARLFLTEGLESQIFKNLDITIYSF